MTTGREIKVLSFFAGIGGIELGLEWAGSGGMPPGWPDAARPPESVFRAVGQIELEPYALSVLGRRWPDVPRFGDITKLTIEELPEADLWCGGFPCQDISTAGKGAGITGSRSGLFFDWMKLVEKARPPMVLMENVGALLFRGLDAVLAELARIGYDAEWECVPAAAVGARHRRDRVFILALSPDAPFPAGCWAGPARAGLLEMLCIGNTGGIWSADPGMDRLVPRRQIVENRLERLGNAVVPQAAELLGTMLLNPLPLPFLGLPFAVLKNGIWIESRKSAFGGFSFSGQWPRSGTMINGVASGRYPCLCSLPHNKSAMPTPSGWDETNPGGSYTLNRSLWPMPTGLTGTRPPCPPTKLLLSGERSHGWDLDTAVIDDASGNPNRAWPTPRGADRGGPQWKTEKTMADSRFSSMLSSEVLVEDSGWFPTPTGSDGPMGDGGFGRHIVKDVADSGRISSLTQLIRVRQAAAGERYPTPRGMDGKMMQDPETWNKRRLRYAEQNEGMYQSLGVAVQLRAIVDDDMLPKDVRLNPEWVEWLMGFPRGWTEA